MNGDNVYFVVKVTAGQEKVVSNVLQNKFSKTNPEGVYSILVIGNIKGYIIVEASDEVAAKSFVLGSQNVKGILPRPVSKEEVEKLIMTKAPEQEVADGDIVEFSTGPFKGYKAKVLKVDRIKAEITVELMDVVVPIPITTKIDTIKIVQKEKESV